MGFLATGAIGEEGPGHMPMDQIAANMKIQQTICMGAPFYVLGPIVTDIAKKVPHAMDIDNAMGDARRALDWEKQWEQDGCLWQQRSLQIYLSLEKSPDMWPTPRLFPAFPSASVSLARKNSSNRWLPLSKEPFISSTGVFRAIT